jgi:holo-[acyl-carrier protein] synthase
LASRASSGIGSGVGIDLLEIERLERALDRHPRLAERVFSEEEIAYARARARPGRHLAARFAAKEAVLKALGMGGPLNLHEVEVRAGEPPTVELHGSAARAAERGALQVRVSLTHSRDLAAAVALAEPR